MRGPFEEDFRKFMAGSSLALAALANRGYLVETLEATGMRQVLLAKRKDTYIVLIRKAAPSKANGETNFLFSMTMQNFTLDELREALADEG